MTLRWSDCCCDRRHFSAEWFVCCKKENIQYCSELHFPFNPINLITIKWSNRTRPGISINKYFIVTLNRPSLVLLGRKCIAPTSFQFTWIDHKKKEKKRTVNGRGGGSGFVMYIFDVCALKCHVLWLSNWISSTGRKIRPHPIYVDNLYKYGKSISACVWYVVWRTNYDETNFMKTRCFRFYF